MISLLQRRSPARKLLFEHVPKCGGTSTSDYLRRHYAARDTYAIYGARPDERRAFLTMPEPDRHGYALILGHGAHALLDFCDPATVVATILRNPVDRIVSHYYFVLATPGHYLHRQVVSRGMSLRDYAASGLSGELRNDMVCRFLGRSSEEAERAPRAAVDAAWDVLRSRYHVVGVLERLAPAMEAIRVAAGLGAKWSNCRKNRTKRRLPIEQLSADNRRVIEEHNALDIQLYERVLAIAPS